MFIPATVEECNDLDWKELDVILVTGDAYIDSSYCGVAIIGKYLIKNGYKVAIISQPSLNNSDDILRFGNPKLFWGVTAGAMDSMVSNYTALKKKRKNDDLTAGGINNKRPDRATIKYVNLIKQYSKNIPVIIGGIEASLRRLAHYDYWDNRIRKSILLDSKADILVYGEGEKTILAIANSLKDFLNDDNLKPSLRAFEKCVAIPENKNRLPRSARNGINSESSTIIHYNRHPELVSGSPQGIPKQVRNDGVLKIAKNIRGICYLTNSVNHLQYAGFEELPSFEEVTSDKNNFKKMFDIFYQNNSPQNAVGLIQKFGNRFVVQNPPNYYLENEELDEVYNLDFENAVHPIHRKDGTVKGFGTTMFSITTHRGCFGECNFCAIAIHQGRKIRSRSEKSIIAEVQKMTNDKRFKGNINDLGGATANMYKMECEKQNEFGSCKNKRCMFPTVCKSRNIGHSHHLQLIKKTLKIPFVKRIFINSGLRFDLIQYDKKFGDEYLEFIVTNCVSGQMKIAPEHTENKVLEAMAKPKSDLKKFYNDFMRISKKANKKQFLTYYLIAGHPNCSSNEMEKMKEYFNKELKTVPEQIQIFTPTPSTYSTLMYYCQNGC